MAGAKTSGEGARVGRLHETEKDNYDNNLSTLTLVSRENTSF